MPVELTQPRKNAYITFEDGRVFRAPIGTLLDEYVRAATASDGHHTAIAAILNGRLTELNRPVYADGKAQLVRLNSADGARIYRRSLTFLLIAAAACCLADAKVYVEHSIVSGGYFCKIEGRPPLTEDEIKELETQMRKMVAQNLPIIRREVPITEAIEIFRQHGDEEKLALLQQRQKPTLIIYKLLDTQDYFHGYMAPSTGYLQYFALDLADSGFLLRFPKQENPTRLIPVKSHPPIFDVFTEYSQWQKKLGIRNVSGLNTAIQSGRLTELILVTEALHDQRISQIAEQIVNRPETRIVLIAGPSASGKTTFARRLAVRLLALGIQPLAISVDDYFVDRAHTPRDEEGNYDFESLYTVDLPLLNKQINQLIRGEEVQMPRFDFHEGKRKPGLRTRIGPNHVLVIEGIHALNPQLLPEVDPKYTYRIYVSDLTQLNLDRYNRISTTDTRLIRRIVRDAHNRGYSAAETIGRWESVRRGERKWIFPHQNNADAMFNSALTYELAVLKPMVEPLLRQIEPGTPEWIEANRLLARLQWFQKANAEHIPSDSILREFIGGSILENYRPWPVS